MQSQIAMGFCSSVFSATSSFQFISAGAVYASPQSQWLQLGNPLTQFPPRGTFYVRDDLIPDSFRGSSGNVAAWVVEDQADWQVSHLGARFRATSLRQPPAEIITVDIVSSDVDAVRRLLLDEGVSFPAGLIGRPILVEFPDNLLAGPFEFHALSSNDNPNRYVCGAAAIGNPLGTWPAQGEGAVSRLVLQWGDRKRIFASNDPLPTDSCAKNVKFRQVFSIFNPACAKKDWTK